MRDRIATCGGCDARWTAPSIAHCGGCHETFSGVGLFDVHRRRSHCTDPATIKIKGELVTRRDTGVWHAPAKTPEEVARMLARTAK